MIPASIIAISVLAILSIFQFALILGAPLGHFAWGGQHKTLPRSLRLGSIVSIIIYMFFAVCISSKAGFFAIITNEPVLAWMLWTMTAYLSLGVFMNALSRSKPERYTMTPVALLLTICFFVIAKS